MKRKQTGFAILETFLILVIIAVISGIGWYAVHTKNQTDEILTQADRTSQNTLLAKQPSNNSPQQYLVIKEWGIKIPLADPIKDAYYVISKDDASVAAVSLHSATAISPNCAPDNDTYMGLGTYFRLTPLEQKETENDPSESGGTKHLGNYYYGFYPSEAACWDVNGPNDKEMEKIIEDARMPFIDSINQAVLSNDN